jgi:CheY-like chemotaxis protein
MSEKTLRVLLVEDNAADAALLEMSLRESAYGKFQVTPARRLSDAVKLLSANAFDAILLDLGLPDSQGVGTLQRTLQSAGTVPIIVLTGLSDDQSAILAMQKGAQDYLVKSQVQAGLVSRAVRYVIERTRAQQASQEAERRLELAVERPRSASGTGTSRATPSSGRPSRRACSAWKTSHAPLKPSTRQSIPTIAPPLTRLPAMPSSPAFLSGMNTAWSGPTAAFTGSKAAVTRRTGPTTNRGT